MHSVRLNAESLRLTLVLLACTSVLFTWFFVASFIPWFAIDSLGRRPLLIGSVSFMAVVFAVMSGLTHQIDTNAVNAHSCGIAAVV